MEAFIGNPMIKALIILFFVSTTTAAGDAPFIIAHKKASLNRLQSGAERVSVSIDIYNQGFSTAYDLSLVDYSWPQDLFDVAIGNTTKSWERLDAGGSLSHSFELEAKKQGIFHGAPAVITFRFPTKVSPQEAYSTPILPLDILAERLQENKLEWAKVCFFLNLLNNQASKIMIDNNWHNGMHARDSQIWFRNRLFNMRPIFLE